MATESALLSSWDLSFLAECPHSLLTGQASRGRGAGGGWGVRLASGWVILSHERVINFAWH